VNPEFDAAVPPTGYRWWYLDALSGDGRFGLTVIAFVGSVFSPYYARARQRRPGQADPMNHCALNVALYARPGDASPTGWTMTERAAAAVQRAPGTLRIGPSALEWDGNALTIHIDEVMAPWPSRVRGTVRLHPDALLGASYALDAAARHHWRPIAPRAHVDVDLRQPGLRWVGRGYIDSNWGARALESDFARWDWSRAALTRKRSAVLYDVTRLDGEKTALALAFDGRGGVQPFTPPPPVALPASHWRVARGTRADAGSQTRIAQTLEDGPFYTRSLLDTQLQGEDVTAVHESLSLQRFGARWVQLLLPFRMPRRAW